MASYEEKVTIADGETASTKYIDCLGKRVVGIYIPASFDGTAITFLASVSADVGFETDDDGTGLPTFLPVYDKGGNAVSITCDDTRFVTLDPALLAGVHFLKLVAGTSQTGDTPLIVTLDAGD